MTGCAVMPRDTKIAFWDAVRGGASLRQASLVAGVSQTGGLRWFKEAGGVAGNAPRPLTARFLSLSERVDIMTGLAADLPRSLIAIGLGRSPSTVGREISRNGGALRYRATTAHRRAGTRAARPKTAKLAGGKELRDYVQARLDEKWSPGQISAMLGTEFPDRPEMRVSTETIYQSLYVQGRGALRRELAVALRTGRAIRKPRRQSDARRSRIPDLVPISERPAQAEDRAVEGHWEGDLIIGKGNKSAIGTLVERTTRYVMLLHLPHGYDAVKVRDAMIAAVGALPDRLKRSMTWDRGVEMTRHAEFTVATDMPVFFCDPHSPWQRGSNENTNGLLRQYFPKGTDLGVHTAEDLAAVAAQLNARPRKTLGWLTPAQCLDRVLSGLPPLIATTP